MGSRFRLQSLINQYDDIVEPQDGGSAGSTSSGTIAYTWSKFTIDRDQQNEQPIFRIILGLSFQRLVMADTDVGCFYQHRPLDEVFLVGPVPKEVLRRYLSIAPEVAGVPAGPDDASVPHQSGKTGSDPESIQNNPQPSSTV